MKNEPEIPEYSTRDIRPQGRDPLPQRKGAENARR